MKKPAGYSGPYTQPSQAGAIGSFVSPTEVYSHILNNEWPKAYVPGVPNVAQIGEIIQVLATGVIDEVNNTASYGNSLLIASGATVSRTTYSGLYEKYGTTFGAGDGSNTFGTLDINKSYSYLVGTTTSGLSYPSQYQVQSVLPNHTHNVNVATGIYNSFAVNGGGSPYGGGNTTTTTYITKNNNNTNTEGSNEGRHRQLIHCLVNKALPECPVGSLVSILTPSYQPEDVPSLSVVPFSYIIPSGQELSRADYPDLFRRIGVLYGAGDGSTTFNVPDLTGLFIRGASSSNYITVSGTDVSISGYLRDALGKHVHTRTNVYYTPNGSSQELYSLQHEQAGTTPSSLSNIGGAETRHRNISVLYYLVAEGSI